MPNLYYLNDHGNVIFRNFDQKVYTKVGTRNDVQPNAQWDAVNDVPSITGVTYGTADAQGILSYTAEQMAIAENLYEYHAQTPAGSSGTWYSIVASTPLAGVIRFNVRDDYGTPQHIRIDGLTLGKIVPHVTTGNVPSSMRFTLSLAYNVAAGSLIEVMSEASVDSNFVVGIIPFQWPQP